MRLRDYQPRREKTSLPIKPRGGSPNVGKELTMTEDRISELNQKFSQVLLFLSFAIVGLATLKTIQNLQPGEIGIYNATLNWWKTALIPTLIGVAPVKELFPDHLIRIRTSKIALLWLAIFVIGGGVLEFLLHIPFIIVLGILVLLVVPLIWRAFVVYKRDPSK
jgi:hypothetical protein